MVLVRVLMTRAAMQRVWKMKIRETKARNMASWRIRDAFARLKPSLIWEGVLELLDA